MASQPQAFFFSGRQLFLSFQAAAVFTRCLGAGPWKCPGTPCTWPTAQPSCAEVASPWQGSADPSHRAIQNVLPLPHPQLQPFCQMVFCGILCSWRIQLLLSISTATQPGVRHCYLSQGIIVIAPQRSPPSSLPFSNLSHSGSSLLKALQRVSISVRVEGRVLMLAYKALHEQAFARLSALCPHLLSSSHSLDSSLLAAPRDLPGTPYSRDCVPLLFLLPRTFSIQIATLLASSSPSSLCSNATFSAWPSLITPFKIVKPALPA